MKSNDWRHKNVARYTPGNTKILYFFNCLLDGMHTIVKAVKKGKCKITVKTASGKKAVVKVTVK